MKKSELTQITQLIEHLVAKEVRKQLPAIIAETFQNMMGKTVVTEQKQPISTVQTDTEEIADTNLKTSLREMFSGAIPSTAAAKVKTSQPPKHFTKDPILNQILNETTSLRQHERSMGSVPAFLNQYQQEAISAGASIVSSVEPEVREPSFTRGMPSLPIGTPPVLREGQESSHIPMSAIPEGVSALDVARSVPIAKPVAQALTRNYSQMMKIIDKKKSGKV